MTWPWHHELEKAVREVQKAHGLSRKEALLRCIEWLKKEQAKQGTPPPGPDTKKEGDP